MSWAVLAVITAALIFGVATAEAGYTVPARYASGPYKAPVQVHRLAPQILLKQCARYGKQPYGCTILTTKACDIYIATVLPQGWYPGVLAHEQAHCRGWPANHPAN